MTTMRMLNLATGYFPSQGEPFSLTEVDNAVSTADTTTYTFSNRSFGSAAPNRYIIVGFGVGSSADTLSSVTIGGVTASEVVSNTAGGDDNSHAYLYIAAVPTGTTGDIVITLGGEQQRMGIVVWRLTTTNPTATDTGGDNSTAVDGYLTDNLTIPTDGAGIGWAWGAGTIGAARTWTWIGLTEDTDETIEGGYTHSSALSTSAGTAERRATPSGTLADAMNLVLAAWGP